MVEIELEFNVTVDCPTQKTLYEEDPFWVEQKNYKFKAGRYYTHSPPKCYYLIPSRWLNRWHQYLTKKGPHPGVIDLTVLNKISRRALDFRGLDEEEWKLFEKWYGTIGTPWNVFDIDINDPYDHEVGRFCDILKQYGVIRTFRYNYKMIKKLNINLSTCTSDEFMFNKTCDLSEKQIVKALQEFRKSY